MLLQSIANSERDYTWGADFLQYDEIKNIFIKELPRI